MRAFARAGSTALGLLFAATSGAALGGAAAPPERATVQSLLSAISENPEYFAPGNELDGKTKLVVELGNAALPELESRFTKTTNARVRESLATAISYIGGTSAVASLKSAALGGPSVQLKSRLAFVIPSAPSGELTVLLQSYLEGPHIGDHWPLIVQAAYSLGIMRARSAVPALRAAADQHDQYSTFASSAARDALDWISGPDVSVLILAARPDDDLLKAVISAGVPTINRRSAWCEHSAGRTWKRIQRNWNVVAGCTGKEPTIRFQVFRSSDGLRAVVALGFYLGSLDGAGYNYLLQKRGDQWVVIGLEFTWVS